MSNILLDLWCSLYLENVKAKYPVHGAKDGKLLKDLRAIYSDEDIARFMRAFFEMDDDFFAQAGWSLGCFRSCLPKVIAFVNRKGSVAVNWKKAPKDLRLFVDSTWEPERDCPHEGRHSTRGVCQMYTSAEKRQRGEVA